MQQIFEEDIICETVNPKNSLGELNNFPSYISTEENFPGISGNIADNGTVVNMNSNNSVDDDDNDEDDDDDDDGDETFPPDLTILLADWAVQFSITLTALSSLLCILRQFHPSLPKDARTILKTKRNFIIEH